MQNKLTFVGHSTVLLDFDGYKIITDPVFSRWVYGVPRFRKAKIDAPFTQNGADLILISHAHKDHLNGKSLNKFSKNIPIGSHTDNKKYLKKCKFKNIFEFLFWESQTFNEGKITITSVPAFHGKTLPWGPIGTSGGFIIQYGQKTIYFAGDTAYDENLFEDIGKRFEIDILLMPVGAYSPRWMLRSEHTNPDEAIKTMSILKAKKMIPIHWGSFMFALDTPSKPIKVLKKRIAGTNMENRVHVLKNGECIYF